MKSQYFSLSQKGFERTQNLKNEMIKESDLLHLPLPVRKYLQYVGVVGKEKLKNIQLKFEGQLRGKPNSDWMQIKALQTSFFDIPTRLFYMDVRMKGIPAKGMHVYDNANAWMLIKIFNLFPVVNAKGIEMNQSETVTFFNDMCLLAPATLIDTSIQWHLIDSLTVEARFSVNKISISATLKFNETGQLIDFYSDDRYCYMPDKSFKKFRWSTPIVEYRNYDGLNLPYNAKAIWKYPEGDFCYGNFRLLEIKYNTNE